MKKKQEEAYTDVDGRMANDASASLHCKSRYKPNKSEKAAFTLPKQAADVLFPDMDGVNLDISAS